MTPEASAINLLLSFCWIIPQGKHVGKGTSDGTYNYKQFFSCQPRCGMFVPFSQIKAVGRSSSSPPTDQPHALPNSEELFVGDRVTYFTPNELRHGMVMDIQEKDGLTMVRVSTVSSFPENGKKNQKSKAKICHFLCLGSKFTQGPRLFVVTVHRTQMKME